MSNAAPWIPRAAPFAAYMGFLLIQDLVGGFLPGGFVKTHWPALVYPLKIIAAAGLLLYFWKSYDELKSRAPTGNFRRDMIAAAGVGVLVFVLWVRMDWPFAVVGDPTVYNPWSLPGGLAVTFIGIRLLGASVVVPIFEELFWRSFLMRYIIKPEFTTVPVGAFTWPSFLIGAALFGSEHHFWLAGIMAGVLYSLLLYRTRSIWACIVSHGLTNLLLGVYVLSYGNWKFW